MDKYSWTQHYQDMADDIDQDKGLKAFHEGELVLTPWGKFVYKYDAIVPVDLWAKIRDIIEQHMTNGSDWRMFLSELVHGCQELSDGKLQEVMCIEDEMDYLANHQE